jgi:stage III sporulation protein SpoIIIAA
MNASDWLELVHSIDCVVCGKRPVEAHHIEHARDDLSAYACAALCADCHRGPIGVHGAHRMGFERRTKLSQLHLLKRTIKAIAKEL